MKKFLFSLFILIITLNTAYSEPALKYKQTPIINRILELQDNKIRFDELAEIINYIDEIYGNLYNTLETGGKLTLYFGPAHGKDETERWRGITTNRVGISGLPEEYYSIHYSRKLYDLLKKNPFLNIVAGDEYRDVLEGRSDIYHYMKFKDVMTNAKNAGSFMVIEMHMNNVSIFSKADGLVNMPGIHMARDNSGRKLLINITGTYSGFLTLYNKYDAGGFSKQYALNIRDSLVSKGYKANSWEYGAVADDRFSYYLNFPVSIIYECGFISHPEEEKMLLDEKYMDGMINTQYHMLLKTFEDIYGIDISGNSFKGKPKDFKSGIELLKLARLAIYFIKHADTSGANIAIKAMNNHYYNSKTKDSINYYNSILRTINNAEYCYKKGIKYRNRKKYNKARASFVSAREHLNRNEMYYAYKTKYISAIHGNKSNRTISKMNKTYNKRSSKSFETAVSVKPSSLTKPFIISLNNGENLNNAVFESLEPDTQSLKKIVDSMNSYKSVSWKKTRIYSSRKKRKITVYKKKIHDFNFYQGIYVVQLDRNMRVVKAKRVSSVYLDPNKYQNQQYLKNSYFTEIERDKNI